MNSPVKATVRVFNPLFNSDNPDGHPGGFLASVNPNSKEVYSDALIETGLEEIKRRAPWPNLDGERAWHSETLGRRLFVSKECALAISVLIVKALVIN